MTDPLLDALATAVAAAPTDVELRIVYGSRLADAGDAAGATGQALVALAHAPGHAAALELLARVAPGQSSEPAAAPAARAAHEEDEDTNPAPATGEVDWSRHETELGLSVPPPFLEGAPAHEDAAAPPMVESTRESVTLADVGGLEDVKKKIRQTFLDPIAHRSIARAFRKTLRGGMLLYGPPGCGKTFIARAIAGELGAGFISVSLTDILDKWLGNSEANMHAVFEEARQSTPTVLFFDEIDAIGGRRSSQSSSSVRNVVNQLLIEMDGVDGGNDGIFVLAATNTPWDVDPALLRPGRFDRTVAVLPPDAPAREAILRAQLAKLPIEGIDLPLLVKRTEGFSGADLAHLCDTGSERAMDDSIREGVVRPVHQSDMLAALDEVRPSVGAWLESARNVAMFGNSDGRYDDLVAYLSRRKML